ncbi:phosphatase PAP2 family protein [Rudanella paleaurantiibacter]|uniref:Phosphatase PAP2 family protein n=1 Tax=Rudanella paleaurantiibacter TaxID=2614655 RepID=A0A7J5U0Q4_9BACT|nr:phosphatase PAP2 family protein [Rudanella paleaurantiibacter]KAB7731207.1 phosphatase PAP2 family protein [Rudanella paleaurantiibacter]
MKSIYKFLLVSFVAATSSALLTSCDKTIEEPLRVGYTPATLDDKAGTWKPYILSTPTAVTVAAPVATTSSAYAAELSSLKAKSAELTRAQQEAVVYWGAGAVYRWNEIARELAAKYNLPPASNAAGTYPVPDPANPNADPRFPFANPPYTARALAYLSVAQYDALVATWHYKYLYKRVAPSKVDAGIRVALPVSSLPSYPSEDAVVAAASAVVLKAMFPGEVAFIDAKVAEHAASRQWAGMNVESDLTAGSSLGTQVAALVMGRARTDGMSAANNQSLTAGMIEAAQGRGQTQIWLSQESPIRPPMLPNYGAVSTWNFDRATLVKLRPGPAPLPGTAQFDKELDELKTIQKTQTREQARIANFWADGAGSYTPPGHWHRIAANAAHEARYSEVRMARTLALLGTTLQDAGVCCWETKFYYYTPRPQQFGVKTSVGLPNFPSYTSGHSTFSGAAATVLSYIFPERSQEFMDKATEASVSRIYGLIHFRSDCETGLICGKNIGSYAVNRGKADGSGL